MADEVRRQTVQVLIDGQPHELTILSATVTVPGAPHTTVSAVNASTPAGCPAHDPKQHRDRRPPWCDTCGRTADGSPPDAPAEPSGPVPPIPPAGTRVREVGLLGRTGYSQGPDPDQRGHLLVDWDGQERIEPYSVHVSKVRVLPAVR